MTTATKFFKTGNCVASATRYRYDALGQRIDTETPSVARYTVSANNTLEFVGYQTLHTQVRYDQAGRRVEVSDGNGDLTRYRYDLAGNLVASILPLGQTTRYEYDAQNRKIAEIDGNGNRATWRYDYFGQLQSHSDFGGAIYTYTYDHARQLIAQSNTRGQDLHYRYDARGQVQAIEDRATDTFTRYAYDLAGNRTLVQTRQGDQRYQDQTRVYDALGRLQQVTERAAGLVQIDYQYDAAGNRSQIHTRIQTASLQQEQTRYLAYDALNRATLVDALDPDGSLGSSGHAYTYDLAGNRVTDRSNGRQLYRAANGAWQVRAGETTTVYRYDAAQRLVSTERDGLELEPRYYDGSGSTRPPSTCSMPAYPTRNKSVPTFKSTATTRTGNCCISVC